MEAVDDLTSLPDLDEPNMLHSLCVRYSQKKIYTRTGPILVGINPWEDLNLYGSDTLFSYRRQKMDRLPPHVFAISENAFVNLQSERKDQTILVSGDSGSGKTESTKFMMQYLAAVSHHTAVTASTEQQVLQCNPVLEAFGNAKTLRNDNSSRFGKYIDIHFDDKFALCGAKIFTYLLEKSRVVSQEPGERNFHIFYQLCSQAGTNPALTRDLELLPPEQFHYVRQGANITVNYKSANSFNHTLEAFEAIGIRGVERDEIFRVLAAVLHLGNLQIASDGTGPNADAMLSEGDRTAIVCSRMLGCTPGALINALVMRNIQVGSVGGSAGGAEVYTVSVTQQQAEDARNAMARVLYGSLFDALVLRINKSLGFNAGVKLAGTISILDIFGFEHFKTNHFEQFCINYANEKLQGHFNEFNFSLEVKEYEREEIQWSYDDFYFQTNTKCIELIEGKRTGILALLDEQCIMPNGTDETFCLKLQQIVDHPHLQLARMSVTQFTVKHYAADVNYDVAGFCTKNKDPVQPAVTELLSKGSSPYVQMLFNDPEVVGRSLQSESGQRGRISSATRGMSTIIFESVTAKFKRQLADLMSRIYAAQPHFVRCINPNSQKIPRLLEPEMVLDQLRCSGLMEAVRVSRAGFPVRIVHEDFVVRFSLLKEPARPSEPWKNQVQSMMVALGIRHDSYRIGITKLFLRREVHEKLEEERSRLLVRQALEIQRVCRGHIARVYVRYLRKIRLESAFQLQRHVRKALAYLWYQKNLQAWKAQIAKTAKAASPPPPVQVVNEPPVLENGHFSPNRDEGRYRGLSPRQDSTNSSMRAGSVTPMGGQRTSIGSRESQMNLAGDVYKVDAANQIELSKILWEIRFLQSSDDMEHQLQTVQKAMDVQRTRLATLAAERDRADDQMNKWMTDMATRHMDQLEACKAILAEKLASSRRERQEQLAAAYAVQQAQRQAASQESANQIAYLQTLLREKDAEIRQMGGWLSEAQSKASRIDTIREELQEQFREQQVRKMRHYEVLADELRDAKELLQWKDADLEQLNQRLNQVRQIAAVALKMDIGGGYFDRDLAAELLEANIRGPENLRALINSDLEIYTREQRIAQLAKSLDEARARSQDAERQSALDLLRKAEEAQAEIRKRDARIEEMSVRLYMMTEMAMRLNDQQQPHQQVAPPQQQFHQGHQGYFPDPYAGQQHVYR